MTPQTCFQSADLVLLLGRSGRASSEADAVRRHVAACETCQRELEHLRAGFDNVAPVPIPDEGIVLRRIEEVVLAGMAAQGTGALTTPVPPRVADPSLARLLTTGTLTSVAVSLLGLLLFAMLSQPGDVRIASLAALLLPALLLPGLILPAGPRWLLLATALMSAVALTFLGAAGRDGELAKESMCLLFAGVGVIPGVAIVRAALRIGPSGRSGEALVGAAISAGGLGVQASLCHTGSHLHLAVLHLLPFFLGTLALAALSRRFRPGAALPRRAMVETDP